MFYRSKTNLKNNVKLKLDLIKEIDTRFLQRQLKQWKVMGVMGLEPAIT